MTLALTLAFACRFPVDVGQPPVEDPGPGDGSSEGSVPAEGTQIGDEGTQYCEELILDPTDSFATGEPLADTLALIPAGSLSLAPAWFDGRAVPLQIDLVPDLATLRISNECTILVDAHASIVSDDGAVTIEADDLMLLEPGEVWLSTRIADDAWTGALDPATAHTSPCADDGSFGIGLGYLADGTLGGVSHTCDLLPVLPAGGGNATADTTTPDTTTGDVDSGDTGTDTETGMGEPSEDNGQTVSIVAW